MALYAIGDVQGCYDALCTLLDKLHYDPSIDRLWFVGDLVNRGPQSLAVLRLVRSLPNTQSVLGNHDLHLLAVAAGTATYKKHDTFNDVLEAEDREALLNWLRQRPLLLHDDELHYTLVHAGLLPSWDLPTARRLATEAEQVIANSETNELFSHMYGDQPDHWHEDLTGWERLRVIINCYTRLRFCDRDGRMELRLKVAPGERPAHLYPWFQVPERKTRHARVVFGHWSTLGVWNADGVLGIDSGCLWGGKLTAVRLDTDPPQFSAISCTQMLAPLTD